MELLKNLKVDSVSRLNLSPPLCVPPEQTVAEAVRLMRSHGFGCLLITVEQKVVGIFTERDLLRRVLAVGKPLTIPLADCMTHDPAVIDPKESLAAAVRCMEEGGYRHLPVVDDTGTPIGVLSVKRIVHYLVEHFPGLIYNLPPDPAAVPHEAEGA